MCNYRMFWFIIVICSGLCLAKELYDKLDRFIIACHTSDFVCFKRQYQSLRDHVLLGNSKLGLEDFEPYYFQYGDSGTCIRMSGLEESQLTGIGFNSDTREFTLILELPLKLQQVENNTKCSIPEQEFKDFGTHFGPMKKFTGNATIQVNFPYDLKKKKGKIHMVLGEEGLDVILDIPDLTDYKSGNEEERQQYELAEWAYEVVQHINGAQAFALPYTERMRLFTDRIPLKRWLLLYPEEEYTDVHLTYSESPFFETSKWR